MSRNELNVVIFGHSGVGKSSLINMLCPGANAHTSNDTTGCTKKEHEYKCVLGPRQSCQLHDTIGLEEGFWGFLWAPKAEKRLKQYLKTIKPHLLVYCMPGTRNGLKKSHGRNFNKFKSMVGSRVQVVVVVTHVDSENGDNPEDWWTASLSVLRRLDIPESTRHVCVSTLPEVHTRLYQTSCEAVKALIRNNLTSH